MAEKQVLAPFATVAPRANIQQDPFTYTKNQTTRIELKRTGFLAGLYGVLIASLTMPVATQTATGTYGIEKAINRIRLVSNTGTVFYDTSGLGNYIVQRTRKKLDYKSVQSTTGSSTVAALFYNYPSAPASGSTVEVRLPIDLRNVLGEKELNSLILLEGKSTFYLEITWADFATALWTPSTGTITVNSVEFVPEADTFLIPNVPYDPPAVSPVVQVLQEQRAFNTTQYRWYPRTRGALLRATFWLETSAGVIYDSSRLTDYEINFGNTQTPVQGKIVNKLWADVGENDGMTMPNGFHTFDFMMGSGDSKVMPSTRDVITIADGDDVYIQLTASAVAAGDTINFVCEYLKRATEL